MLKSRPLKQYKKKKEGEGMARCHLFSSKYYMISEFWVLVPFMCCDVLIQKNGGQYGSFSTKKQHFSDVWSKKGSLQHNFETILSP